MPLLSSREKAFLQLTMEPEQTAALTPEEAERVYAMLIEWCREQLCSVEPQGLDKRPL